MDMNNVKVRFLIRIEVRLYHPQARGFIWPCTYPRIPVNNIFDPICVDTIFTGPEALEKSTDPGWIFFHLPVPLDSETWDNISKDEPN